MSSLTEHTRDLSSPRAATRSGATPPDPLQLRDAALGYGSNLLWSHLDLTVRRGDFLAVLGANGSGKSSLLRAILGLQRLTAGELLVDGLPARRGGRAIGYIPQQKRWEPATPLRARDVVRQGIDGHRWGIARPGRLSWTAVDAALTEVDAHALADAPIGLLSGGEQQRVRIAQALVSDPALLLCDEPLLSLDLRSQRTVTGLIDQRRHRHDTAVVFVTHEINPVLPYVDRVLYLAGGQFRIGSVDEVLNSETLSELYDAPIEVVRVNGRILVAGVPEAADPVHHDSHHQHDDRHAGEHR